MRLTSAGRDLVARTLADQVARITLLAGDREIVTLLAPGFRGVARIGGTLSGYQARDGSGRLLFDDRAGDGLTATADFIEQGAEVRIVGLDVEVG